MHNLRFRCSSIRLFFFSFVLHAVQSAQQREVCFSAANCFPSDDTRALIKIKYKVSTEKETKRNTRRTGAREMNSDRRWSRCKILNVQLCRALIENASALNTRRVKSNLHLRAVTFIQISSSICHIDNFVFPVCTLYIYAYVKKNSLFCLFFSSPLNDIRWSFLVWIQLSRRNYSLIYRIRLAVFSADKSDVHHSRRWYFCICHARQ